jgi:hypothetical protein
MNHGCFCFDGWVCEQHPDRCWPHDDCPGPGMPCVNPECAAGLVLRAELAMRRPESEPKEPN